MNNDSCPICGCEHIDYVEPEINEDDWYIQCCECGYKFDLP